MSSPHQQQQQRPLPVINLAQLLGPDIRLRQVHVKTAAKNVKAFTVNMLDNTDLSSLKIKVESESSIPARFQRLLYEGKVLEDTMMSTIKNQGTIHLAPYGPEAAEAFGFSFSEPQAVAYRYTPPAVDLDRTISIYLKSCSENKVIRVQPSMTVDSFKSLVQETFGDEIPIDRVDFLNHNRVYLEKGFRLVDYNIREAQGSYLTVQWYKSRNDRILRPLATTNISPSLYPTALANLTANNADVMFAAVKKTLASVLDATSGERKRSRSGGNDESTSERRTRPRNL